MCSINPDYEPEIYQVKHYSGTQIDCYFTNGDVRRYDIASAMARGGVFSPLADISILKASLTVYNGCLAFDLKGTRDPFEIIDFCSDTVYEKGVSVVGQNLDAA